VLQGVVQAVSHMAAASASDGSLLPCVLLSFVFAGTLVRAWLGGSARIPSSPVLTLSAGVLGKASPRYATPYAALNRACRLSL